MKSTYTFLFIITLILLSNISFSQSVPSYVPTNGLVGWWGFNGNAQDGSGNGNHGTVNGATLTTDRFGNQNEAYDFNTTTSRIQLPITGHINSANQLTFTGFFNLSNSTSGDILGNWTNYNASGPIGLILSVFQGQLYAAVNGGHDILSYQSILPNQWYQYTFVFDGTNPTVGSRIRMYLNGSLQPISNLSNNPPTPSSIGNLASSTYLGCRQTIGGFTQSINGKLDDIGIWNRALTQQEITNLYNSQLPTQTSLCLPTITTTLPSSVGVDTVVIGGDISNDGGSSIVLRGICYSTSPNPNMGNLRTEDGSGIGSFNTVLRGLNPSTTYYARSYAKNSNGVVVYGNEVSFTTSAPAPSFACGTSTVSDVDNNTYNTVQIGNQCWTQSNLKTGRYRNGDTIPTGLSNSAWETTTSGAYAIYNNDPVNDGLYGKLYNHYAVTDTRGLCPTGWHVPTDSEWNVMVKYLDPNADTACAHCLQSSIAGGSMKSTAMQPTPAGWHNAANTGATNSSGFTGLPGGVRTWGGGFLNLGFAGNWWSSSVYLSDVAWQCYLNYGNADAYRYYNRLRDGFSVRCLKD